MRKIIHLDMDCFYAAIEMRERPELSKLPIAVGGGSRRGVVTTCNYEARKLGVRSAMPGFQARQLCPHLVFLPVRFDLYRQESARIRRILMACTPLVETLSLDEAFLDVSALDRYAWTVAAELRASIRRETGLTASAGVAPNKMLAKIASEWRKPNGQFAITPEQVDSFVRELPVRRLWGVGPRSAERLSALGIETCGDMQRLSAAELVTLFGRWGRELYDLCRGRDERPVEPHRIRKSLSNERTYMENLHSLAQCRAALDELIEELVAEVSAKASDRKIRKAFVKIRTCDFARLSRECLVREIVPDVFHALLRAGWESRPMPVRLLGVGVRFEEIGAKSSAQGLLTL